MPESVARRTIAQNLRVFIPVAIFQTSLYWILNHYQWFPARELPETFVDRAIPFLPWTVVPYGVLLTAGMIPALVAQRDLTIRRLVTAYAISAAITAAFFIFYPTLCRRPEIPASATGWDWELFRFLTTIDTTACCFPSFHIILPTLCCWSAVNENRRWGWPFAAAAAVLSLTILTTKQHYFWDLIGGYAVAGLGIWAACRVHRAA